MYDDFKQTVLLAR